MIGFGSLSPSWQLKGHYSCMEMNPTYSSLFKHDPHNLHRMRGLKALSWAIWVSDSRWAHHSPTRETVMVFCLCPWTPLSHSVLCCSYCYSPFKRRARGARACQQASIMQFWQSQESRAARPGSQGDAEAEAQIPCGSQAGSRHPEMYM